MAFMATSATGLIALLLIAVGISIPYTIRWINRRFRTGQNTFKGGMSVHQVLGYSILALAFVHMYISMGGGMAMKVNATGLNAATLALLLLLVQTTLGISRPRPSDAGYLIWRRVHFTVMLALVALVLVHVWYNGMMIFHYLRDIGIDL